MKKPTVLIVDSDEHSRLLLEETFKSSSEHSDNYQVLSTSSGKEAINFCHEYKIELIFTEIYLKDMDGWQLTQKIKELYPSIPIIIQTSVITDDIAQKVWESGADSYLAKPVDIYEMQTKVENIL
jgi:CheY-like chemotaxis protein